jgi:hypothetical protein
MNYLEVKQLYAKNGYKFREEVGAINIFGIRSKTSKSDKFDDLGGVAYKMVGGQTFVDHFWMTTDPGKHWLTSPMNKNGTIILVPGQYINVYTKGLHNGEYDCFKQVGQMAYVRDYNKDTTLDFDLYRNPEERKIRLFWGVNGTNLHRASKWKIVELIGSYSAGCQVVQRAETFEKLLKLRDWSNTHGYTHWDYSLFEE